MFSKLTGEPILHSGGFLRAALLGLMSVSAFSYAQETAPVPDSGLVRRALANELKSAQDASHPMQYRLRKSSPRLISTKQIVETGDGAVARLLSINDAVPSAADREKDETRLDALLADPGRQRKRKQGELADRDRALKVLRALPDAFLYQYEGTDTSAAHPLARYAFSPNPNFSTSDLELMVLTAMSGTLTVDTTCERAVRLEGRLQQDVEIGWGLLGRLDKGGWILIEQGDVGGGQWRIVQFKMAMSARVLFRTRHFDTTEEQSHFAPVPVGLTYQKAIQMLRSDLDHPAIAGADATSKK